MEKSEVELKKIKEMQVEAEWSKARKSNASGNVLVQTKNVNKPVEDKEKAEMQK